MDAEQIARSLGGAKQSGGNWSCKCPAHEDNKASLSIGHGRDGKLVVHCHAGCSQESVIDWLKALDMWPTAAKQTPVAAVPPVRINLGQSRGAIVATYDYVNEDGELLYQAVRYDPKDFRQRAPKPDGTWSWTIKGVRRVLYRLPEVLAAVAEGKTIYICEGEKDVEASRSIGLVATCNAMGADNGGGNKWLPEFADVLAGADVVVVPDQDESGKRHAGWVIKTLTGKARNLGLLNVRHGKDIADWIEAGATVSDIEGAIVDAIEVEVSPPKEEAPAPAQELPRENMFVSVGDLIDDLKPIEWLVEDYIEADSLALIFGPPAGGKSFITVDLACCIATGTPWHGRPVKQGAVFYIAGEGHNGLARRFAAWSKATGVSLKGAPLFKSTRAVAIYNEESAIQLHEDIIVMAEQHQMQPAMVAIDTVARNFGGGDENSTEDMSKFIEHVDTFVRRPFACNVNMVHHSGHNMDRARGSSALKAALDAEYAVVKEGDMLTFTATKMKDAEMPPELTFKFKVVELGEVGGHDITSVVLEQSSSGMEFKVGQDSDHADITAKQVLEALSKGWLPYSQLKDALNCTPSTAKRVVLRCAEKGFLEKDGQEYKMSEKARQLISLTGANLTRKGAGVPIWKQREKD